jgi:hypothetical protein
MAQNNEKLMRDALDAITALKSRCRELETYVDRLERMAGVPASKSRVRGPLEAAIGDVLERAAAEQRRGSATVDGAFRAEVAKRRRGQAEGTAMVADVLAKAKRKSS